MRCIHIPAHCGTSPFGKQYYIKWTRYQCASYKLANLYTYRHHLIIRRTPIPARCGSGAYEGDTTCSRHDSSADHIMQIIYTHIGVNWLSQGDVYPTCSLWIRCFRGAISHKADMILLQTYKLFYLYKCSVFCLTQWRLVYAYLLAVYVFSKGDTI